MKAYYLCIALIIALTCFDVKAQNMVPNGDFEDYTTCPTALGEIAYCTGWRTYQGTCDYYNSCSPNTTAGVPVNAAGYQYAASGNGYTDLIDYRVTATTIPIREYLARVITPLSAGSIYEVSMSVSLPNFSGHKTGDLGVLFYLNGPSFTTGGTIPRTPQVSYASYGVISDTANWVRLVDTVTADSAYENIVIGGFASGVSYGSPTFHGSGSFSTYATYYIDSVVVRSLRGISFRYKDTALCAGDTMKVPYTVSNELGYYTSTNVFRFQLSNASGSFASPAILDTIIGNTSGILKYVIPFTITPGNGYRIRIISTNGVDSSMDNEKDISIGNTVPSKPVAGNSGPVCASSTIFLSAASTTTGVRFSWTGPDNFTSNTQNPAITGASSANSGDYILTSTLYGCRSKDTTQVTVAGTGNATATANGPVCENDTLKLSGTAVAGATGYTWTGPNGFVSHAKDTFIAKAGTAAAGIYAFTVALTIGCNSNTSVNVAVVTLPVAHSASGNSPLCGGADLHLSASTTTTGVSYIWSGPASFSSGSPTPVITNIPNSLGGRYIVAVINNGCAVYDTVNVTVNQSPTVITASSNIPVCEPDTLKLYSTNSSTGVSWSWSGPNSFSATSQNTYIANTGLAASGRYHIIATAANGCFRKDSADIIIKPQPASFSIGSNSPICQGGTLLMSGNTTSSGVTFSWAGPSGYTSTLQNLSFTNAQPSITGRYILTATLNGCNIRDTEMVNVIAIPATPVPTANTPVCVGQTLILNAGSPGPGYVWTGPGSFSSNAQMPGIPNANLVTTGTYSVRAIDGACTSPTATINVTVLPAPVASMYPSPKDSICQGTMLTLIASASNAGTGYTFKWFRNNTVIGGASGSNHSNTTTNDYDTYFCTVTSNGTCAIPMTDTSNLIQMRVFPWLTTSVSITATPNGTVSGGDLITFNAIPVNGGNTPAYQWVRNNKNEVGATGNTWGAKTLSDKDVVCVTMISNYLCPQPKTANSNCITVSVNTTGIDDGKFMRGVKVYPNPVTNELVIEGILDNTMIQLTDAIGRVVSQSVSTQTLAIINTSQLPSGTYILYLRGTNGDRTNVKVVKQ